MSRGGARRRKVEVSGLEPPSFVAPPSFSSSSSNFYSKRRLKRRKKKELKNVRISFRVRHPRILFFVLPPPPPPNQCPEKRGFSLLRCFETGWGRKCSMSNVKWTSSPLYFFVVNMRAREGKREKIHRTSQLGLDLP